MKRKKNGSIPEVRTIVLGLLISYIIVFMIFEIFFVNCRFLKVRDGVLKRDLEHYVLLLDENPEDRYIAWHSELPKFIFDDIKYAIKKGYDVEYTFYDNIILISEEDGKIVLVVNPDNYYNISYNKVSDFSIYLNSLGEIVIYGYEDIDWFSSGTLSKDKDFYLNTLTYDTNLPFDIYDDGYVHGYDAGEYSIVFDTDSKTQKCRLLFYKDGLLVSITSFQEKIQNYDSYNGSIITPDNKVYMVFIEMENDKPVAKFIYVGTAEYCYDMESLYANNFSLPILKLNEEYYTVSANNWDIYSAYSMSSGSVLTEDINKSKAKFYNSSSDWFAKIKFDVNGMSVDYFYEVNGFDESVGIYEDEIEELSKTVYSTNEFWDQIEEIRSVYAKRYDYRP